MNSLDNILELLLDQNWHGVNGLSAKLGLPEPTLKAILRFLSEHGFVEYRESDQAVKIRAEVKELMETRTAGIDGPRNC